jgi:hypothetical protein
VSIFVPDYGILKARLFHFLGGKSTANSLSTNLPTLAGDST